MNLFLPSTRIVKILTSTAAIVALSCTAIGCITRGSGGSGGPPGRGPAYENGGNPLVAGHATSVATATRLVGFRLLMPRPTSAIGDVELSRTWVNPKDRQAALVFDGGKITVMMWPVPADRKNAIAYYKGIIKDHLGNDHIGIVDGVPALIIKQHTDVKHKNPAWIEFYKRGIDVTVYSAHYQTSALVKLADTLK